MFRFPRAAAPAQVKAQAMLGRVPGSDAPGPWRHRGVQSFAMVAIGLGMVACAGRTGCGGPVPLRYAYPPGTTTPYRLHVEQHIDLTTQGQDPTASVPGEQRLATIRLTGRLLLTAAAGGQAGADGVTIRVRDLTAELDDGQGWHSIPLLDPGLEPEAPPFDGNPPHADADDPAARPSPPPLSPTDPALPRPPTPPTTPPPSIPPVAPEILLRGRLDDSGQFRDLHLAEAPPKSVVGLAHSLVLALRECFPRLPVDTVKPGATWEATLSDALPHPRVGTVRYRSRAEFSYLRLEDRTATLTARFAHAAEGRGDGAMLAGAGDGVGDFRIDLVGQRLLYARTDGTVLTRLEGDLSTPSPSAPRRADGSAPPEGSPLAAAPSPAEPVRVQSTRTIVELALDTGPIDAPIPPMNPHPKQDNGGDSARPPSGVPSAPRAR